MSKLEIADLKQMHIRGDDKELRDKFIMEFVPLITKVRKILASREEDKRKNQALHEEIDKMRRESQKRDSVAKTRKDEFDIMILGCLLVLVLIGSYII